jgi:hypothetical protein
MLSRAEQLAIADNPWLKHPGLYRNDATLDEVIGRLQQVYTVVNVALTCISESVTRFFEKSDCCLRY